jgi:hypothetical protein
MSQGFFFGGKKMPKYYPEAFKIKAKQADAQGEITYVQDGTDGLTYVRFDMMPDAHPALYLLFTICAFFSTLSSLLARDFWEAAILAVITAIFVWRQLLVQKQWQAIQDALP